MRFAKTLDELTTQAVYSEMKLGYELAKEKKYDESIPFFIKAWSLIPEPKYDWDISMISLFRITKIFRDAGLYQEALDWAEQIANCEPSPGDSGPLILKGSIYLEWGNEAEAKKFFELAYKVGGKRGFQGEDPRYLKILKSKSIIKD